MRTFHWQEYRCLRFAQHSLLLLLLLLLPPFVGSFQHRQRTFQIGAVCQVFKFRQIFPKSLLARSVTSLCFSVWLGRNSEQSLCEGYTQDQLFRTAVSSLPELGFTWFRGFDQALEAAVGRIEKSMLRPMQREAFLCQADCCNSAEDLNLW